MQTYQPSNFARNDTLLGICQSIGEDVGFNPNYLRVSLATMVFFSLGAAVAVYLSLGVVVLATRLLHRAPRKPMPQAQATEAVQADAPAAAVAQNDPEFVPMAAAA